jgi:hypothetical protein
MSPLPEGKGYFMKQSLSTAAGRDTQQKRKSWTQFVQQSCLADPFPAVKHEGAASID